MFDPHHPGQTALELPLPDICAGDETRSRRQRLVAKVLGRIVIEAIAGHLFQQQGECNVLPNVSRGIIQITIRFLDWCFLVIMESLPPF